MRTVRRKKNRSRTRTPTLRLTPYAWGKLLFLRDLGPTEVGGFGIAHPDDPLLIEDVRLVRQTTTVVSVAFDDDSVADLFDTMVDLGHAPASFARVWVHTHPADSAMPSTTDEETFGRCFGGCDWAVMFIVACGGETYARLRFGIGPGGEIEIPVEVDWSVPFDGSDAESWETEYSACIENAEQVADHGRWDVPEWDDLVWSPTDDLLFEEDFVAEDDALVLI